MIFFFCRIRSLSYSNLTQIYETRPSRKQSPSLNIDVLTGENLVIVARDNGFVVSKVEVIPSP